MNYQKTRIGKLDCVLVSRPGLQQPKAVVILCHGFGAPGEDLVSIGTELIGMGGYPAEAVYLFPAAPMSLDWGFDSRAWWMIDVERLQYLMAMGQTREMRSVDPLEIDECNGMIGEIIEWSKNQWSLTAQQIVVGGFSQGSMLMTDVALNWPEPLGGLVIWSGALIREAKWKAAAERQAKLNVIQSHGNQDQILSLAGARDLQNLLVSAGHGVKFQEFNGPHTIPMASLDLAAELISSVIEFSKRLQSDDTSVAMEKD